MGVVTNAFVCLQCTKTNECFCLKANCALLETFQSPRIRMAISEY